MIFFWLIFISLPALLQGYSNATFFQLTAFCHNEVMESTDLELLADACPQLSFISMIFTCFDPIDREVFNVLERCDNLRGVKFINPSSSPLISYLIKKGHSLKGFSYIRSSGPDLRPLKPLTALDLSKIMYYACEVELFQLCLFQVEVKPGTCDSGYIDNCFFPNLRYLSLGVLDPYLYNFVKIVFMSSLRVLEMSCLEPLSVQVFDKLVEMSAFQLLETFINLRTVPPSRVKDLFQLCPSLCHVMLGPRNDTYYCNMLEQSGIDNRMFYQSFCPFNINNSYWSSSVCSNIELAMGDHFAVLPRNPKTKCVCPTKAGKLRPY